MRVVRLASGVVVVWVAAMSLLCVWVVIASLVLEMVAVDVGGVVIVFVEGWVWLVVV